MSKSARCTSCAKRCAISLAFVLGCATPIAPVYRAHLVIFGPEPVEPDSAVLATFDKVDRCFGAPRPDTLQLFLVDSVGLYVESVDSLVRRPAYGFHQRVGPQHSRIYIDRHNADAYIVWAHELIHAHFWQAGIQPDSTNAAHHALPEMNRCTYAVRLP